MLIPHGDGNPDTLLAKLITKLPQIQERITTAYPALGGHDMVHN